MLVLIETMLRANSYALALQVFEMRMGEQSEVMFEAPPRRTAPRVLCGRFRSLCSLSRKCSLREKRKTITQFNEYRIYAIHNGFQS